MKKSFIILAIVALVGFSLSALSLFQYVTLHLGAEHTSSFCSISEHVDCSRVHLSDWSTIFGVPIASYGLGFYLLILIIALLGAFKLVLKEQESRDFIAVSSLFSVIYSIALFAISEYFIGALCPVCLSMYATNFILAFISWRMGSGEPITKRIRQAISAGIRLLAIWIPQRLEMGFFARFGTVLALCFALALVIAGEPLMTGFYFASQEQANELTPDKKHRIIAQYIERWEKEPAISIDIQRNSALSGDFSKGSEGAAIQIIEFSDFNCPHCQQLGQTLSQLVKEFPNSFEVIHKDFPLDSSCNKFSAGIHPGSCIAAEFSRCAGEQDKFWEVAQVFFTSGVPEGDSSERIKAKLIEQSESLGLNREAITECLDSGRQLEKIRRDAALGDTLKLQGTPSVWINGKFLANPHPDIIQAIIEQRQPTRAAQ